MIKKIMILTLCLLWSLMAFSNDIAEKYLEGMNYYDQGKYGKSIRIFKKILKKYPRASNLGRVQAQIGYAYEKQEKYKKAFKAYEVVFKKFPDFEKLEDIIEREYQMAEKYASGEMKSIFGLDFAESNKTALEIYERVVKNFPFGTHSQNALLRSIHILIRTKKYKEAETKIQLFKKAYEKSPLLDEVYYLDAYAYFLQIEKADYDQKNTLTSIEKFETYVKEYPSGQFKDKVDAMLKELIDITCEQKYKTADFYLKQNMRPAAEKYLKEIIEKYPATNWAKMSSQKLAA